MIFIIVVRTHLIQFTISMAIDLNNEEKHFVNKVVLSQPTYKTGQTLSTLVGQFIDELTCLGHIKLV